MAGPGHTPDKPLTGPDLFSCKQPRGQAPARDGAPTALPSPHLSPPFPLARPASLWHPKACQPPRQPVTAQSHERGQTEESGDHAGVQPSPVTCEGRGGGAAIAANIVKPPARRGREGIPAATHRGEGMRGSPAQRPPAPSLSSSRCLATGKEKACPPSTTARLHHQPRDDPGHHGEAEAPPVASRDWGSGFGHRRRRGKGECS